MHNVATPKKSVDINAQAHIGKLPDLQNQPRAQGGGAVVVAPDETGRTRLRRLRQSGATKLVFPRQITSEIQAILINTAGGVTGGDQFDFFASVHSFAHLAITTQAAERAYQAKAGEIGLVATQLNVDGGGRLDWLPQELILFEGAALHRRLDIDLASDAQLLMVEPLVFGRAAMGERLVSASFLDRITIRRAGQPLYMDALDLRNDLSSLLARQAIAGGAGAMASCILVRPDAAALLPIVRALLPTTAGASLLEDDMLVLRFLAQDSFELRRHLVPIVELLLKRKLPTSWRL